MARFVLASGEAWVRPGFTNFCSVKALAITCDLTLDDALKHAARCGRKPKRGISPWKLFPMRRVPGKPWKRRQTVNGARVVEITYPTNLTLATFLDRHRTGRYIITVTGHAMAVVDGAVHDHHQPRESIKVRCIMKLKVPRRRRKAEQQEARGLD